MKYKAESIKANERAIGSSYLKTSLVYVSLIDTRVKWLQVIDHSLP